MPEIMLIPTDEINVIPIARRDYAVSVCGRVVCKCDGATSHNDANLIADGLRALSVLPTLKRQNQALADAVRGERK